LLYALLIVALVGIVVARPHSSFPAFITWVDPELGSLFPILFVTVACGAISGYHSVVAGGTTAKQLDRESDARPIGYGGMLVESLLAAIAVITVTLLSRADYGSMVVQEGPVAVFSSGIGVLIGALGIDRVHGTTFAALAVSAFVLTTLDTSTRLARFAVQEFFDHHPFARNRIAATVITVGAAAVLAFSGKWKAIWPLFGSANQLLAALALLAVSLWLKARGRKRTFVRIPMIIMFVITVSALCVIVWMNVMNGTIALAIIAAALLVLTAVLLVKALRAM
jgi:carbon starvation protein